MGFKNLLNVLGIASEEYENEEYSDEYEEVESIDAEKEDITEDTSVSNKYDDTIVTSRNVTQIAANKNVAQKRPMESAFRYRSNIETIKPAMYSDAHKIIEKLSTLVDSHSFDSHLKLFFFRTDTSFESATMF